MFKVQVAQSVERKQILCLDKTIEEMQKYVDALAEYSPTDDEVMYVLKWPFVRLRRIFGRPCAELVIAAARGCLFGILCMRLTFQEYAIKNTYVTMVFSALLLSLPPLF